MLEIVHELLEGGGVGLERRHADQGLSSGIIRNQMHGRHLGISENRECSPEIRSLHPGLDEADPRTSA